MVNKYLVDLFVEDIKDSLNEDGELPKWFKAGFLVDGGYHAEGVADGPLYELYAAWDTLRNIGGSPVLEFENTVREAIAAAKKVADKDPGVLVASAPNTIYRVVRKGKIVFTSERPTDTNNFVEYNR